MSIEIRNGKMYKDGKEVKPTFGDLEQIRALKEAERKANEKKVNAKLIEKEITNYYAVIDFTCPICKEKNSVDVFEDAPQEYCIDKTDVDEIDVSCEKCHSDFTIHADTKGKGAMAIYLSYDPPSED